jgi:large subunit ribosomal protein L18
MINKSRQIQRAKVKQRIRKKIRGTSTMPRLVIYRSLHHIYAQIIDDSQSKTIIASSTLSPTLREEIKGIKGKKEVAKRIGMDIAKKAIGLNMNNVIFDRNGYIYHGVVKSLADGAREAGLKF